MKGVGCAIAILQCVFFCPRLRARTFQNKGARFDDRRWSIPLCSIRSGDPSLRLNALRKRPYIIQARVRLTGRAA